MGLTLTLTKKETDYIFQGVHGANVEERIKDSEEFHGKLNERLKNPWRTEAEELKRMLSQVKCICEKHKNILKW